MAQNSPQTAALTRRGEPGLTRWTPFDEMANLRHQMDDLFARAFGYTPLSQMIPERAGMQPDIDITETDDRVLVHAALPGYMPDNINVEATSDTLTIRGNRESMVHDSTAKQHSQGRVTGTAQFDVSFSLPAEVDPNKIRATFRNGVLELEIPKAERAKPRKVQVRVEGK